MKVLRVIIQVVIGLLGLVLIILGATSVSASPPINFSFIVVGATIVIEAVYFLIRCIPRVEGESARSAKEQGIDTAVIIGVLVLGILISVIRSFFG